jgi:hypothetical protein
LGGDWVTRAGWTIRRVRWGRHKKSPEADSYDRGLVIKTTSGLVFVKK